MNKNLQSAMQHPDADQLTAFAEHALPVHEREQTLAHLAVCAGCREMVFLAQEAVPVEVVAPATPVRRPWFAGWTLVWPAVGALAAIVAVTVHLRSVTKPVERVTTADAVTVTAAPVMVQTESAEVAAPKGIAKVRPPKADVARPEVPIPPVAYPDQRPGTGYPGQNQSVVVGAAASPQIAAPAPMAAAPMAAARAGMEARAAAPMPAPAPPPPVQAKVAGNAADASSSLRNRSLLSANASTIEVTNGVVTAVLLPSQLTAISTAVSGARSVAIDSKGEVFLSTDSGRKWKAVKASWDGRAVAVRTTASEEDFVSSNEDQREAKKKASAVPMFALRTDAGVVWVSADGKRWKRE